MRDFSNQRGEPMAFDAATLQAAGVDRLGNAVGGCQQAFSLSRGQMAIRRLRNGWVIDDGRGNEWVAVNAADVLGTLRPILEQVEAADRALAQRRAGMQDEHG